MLPIALLAGGMATRLGALTEKTPKSLIIIEGRPFIDYQLRSFAHAGFSKVVICVGNLANQIIDFVGDGSQYGLEIEYSHDGLEPRGTGGAIKHALQVLGSDFFIQYGDSYLDLNYSEMQSRFQSNSKHCIMSIYQNEGDLDTSNVQILENGDLIYSKSNPTPDMNFIDYGCSILSRENLANYGAPTSFDLSDYLESLSGKSLLSGFQARQRFYEIGSIEGIRDFEQYIRSNPYELQH